jgi:hypothetical protein
MKNQIKILLCALLLMTAASVYAQNSNVNVKDYQDRIEAAYEKMQTNITNCLEDFCKETERILEEVKADSENPCPKNDTVCVCKGNKFCQENLLLMQMNNQSWNDIVKTLKDNENQKQALFLTKQQMVNDELQKKVSQVEMQNIEKISNFKELRNFLDERPITRMSFATVMEYLKKYYTGTKEQKAFVEHLLIHLQTTPKCYEKLNTENYTLKEFCLVDRIRDYFDYQQFLPALEELK